MIVRKIVNPATDKASDYFLKTKDRNGTTAYIVLVQLQYWSDRYNHWVVCEIGDISDGATGAYDINSFGWLFHDDLCASGCFDDLTPCTNWQASTVVHDILLQEGRYIRAQTWRYATFIGGGGKARINGMFTLS